MTVFIIIFMCIAMLAAISSLTYVTTDVIMEAKGMDSYEVFCKWLKTVKLYKLFRKKNVEDEILELESETAEDSVSEPEVVIEPALEEILALPVEPIAVELTQPTAEPIPEIEAEEPEASAEACVESEPEIEAIEEIEAVEEVEEIEEIVPEVVEYVDAEIADTLMSDRLAMKIANVTKGAGKGKLAIINIGDIDSAFEANAVVDIDALKECGLISKKAGRLKILADGTMNKPLTVKAESYSVQAIKMIELTGGEVVILKD